MPISVSPTPNPAALRFGFPTGVESPTTFTSESQPDLPVATDLLYLSGVVSLFFTPTFLTVTKQADADWSELRSQVLAVLEQHYPDT